MQNLPRLMLVVAMLALGTTWTVAAYVGGLHAAPDMSLCEQRAAVTQPVYESPSLAEVNARELTVTAESGADAFFAVRVDVSGD